MTQNCLARFAVGADYLSRFTEQVVGGSAHRELWVPAEELEEFNQHHAHAREHFRHIPDAPTQQDFVSQWRMGQ
jgi:hypothetical protein